MTNSEVNLETIELVATTNPVVIETGESDDDGEVAVWQESD